MDPIPMEPASVRHTIDTDNGPFVIVIESEYSTMFAAAQAAAEAAVQHIIDNNLSPGTLLHRREIRGVESTVLHTSEAT